MPPATPSEPRGRRDRRSGPRTGRACGRSCGRAPRVARRRARRATRPSSQNGQLVINAKGELTVAGLPRRVGVRSAIPPLKHRTRRRPDHRREKRPVSSLHRRASRSGGHAARVRTMRLRRRPLNKSGTGSEGTFRANTFVSTAARRPGERPHGRRVSASTGSRPTKSTSSAVSSRSDPLVLSGTAPSASLRQRGRAAAAFAPRCS